MPRFDPNTVTGDTTGSDDSTRDAGGLSADAGTGSDAGVSNGSACGDPETLIPGWVHDFVPQQERYVSPSGNDANDGSTPALPIQTMARVLAIAQPGMRFNFAPGTYGCGYIANVMGSTRAPLVLRSSAGPRQAKLDCAQGSLIFDGIHGLVVDGFELFNAGGHGILVDSGTFPMTWATVSSDIVLIHNFIHDTALASIKMGQVKTVAIIGNTFTTAGVTTPGRQNVELVAVSDSIIAGNEAYGSTGAFNEVKGGANGALIYRNYIHDSGGGILVGGDCTGYQYLVDNTVRYEANDVVVTDNVVVNSPASAFRVVGCQNCTIANNTAWNSGNQPLGLQILTEGFALPTGNCGDLPTPVTNLTVKNNVFSSTGYTTVVAADVSTFPGTLSHNAWNGGAGHWSDLQYLGDATSLYEANLQLSAPPTNLRPAAGSPLVGQGVPIDGVSGNADGACWEGAPNIGAY